MECAPKVRFAKAHGRTAGAAASFRERRDASTTRNREQDGFERAREDTISMSDDRTGDSHEGRGNPEYASKGPVQPQATAIPVAPANNPLGQGRTQAQLCPRGMEQGPYRLHGDAAIARTGRPSQTRFDYGPLAYRGRLQGTVVKRNAAHFYVGI